MEVRLNGMEAAEIMYGNGVEQVSNMELWDKVCKTDPKHTKKVTLGRTFTAIDPMYQVMTATQHLGMIGEGWGFVVREHIILPTDQVSVLVRVWVKSRKNYIEHWGQSGLYMDKNKAKPDTDCMKKATTDGMTKCLSLFGFNADVFLGKFDDNKYVCEMEREFNQPAKKELSAGDKKNLASKTSDEIIADYKACKNASALIDIQQKHSKKLTRMSEGYPDLFDKINAVGKEILESFKE